MCCIALTLKIVPMVTNINFLLTISIDCQETWLWELINWSPNRKCFDLSWNSLNSFFKKMYRDQFGEFVFGYWDLKGWVISIFCAIFSSYYTIINPTEQYLRCIFLFCTIDQWRSTTETLILCQILTVHLLYVRSSVLHLSLLFIYTKNKRYMSFWRSNVFENRWIYQFICLKI